MNKNEFNVIILDNFSTSKKEYIREDIQYIEADVRDTDKVVEILTKYQITCVVHFCAFSLVGESVQDPLKYYDNNITGMIHLLQAMKKCNVKNLIFSSTAATYGEPEEQPITEDTIQKPINPYGLSKLIMEQIVNTCDFINSIAFRYFNVAAAAYDSWERHNPETHLIPCVIKRKLNGQNCYIFGDNYPTRDGTCIRDYIHVKDLSEAHYLGIKRLFENQDKIIHEAYNLGTKSGLSVKEIVSEIDCPYEIKERRAGDPAVLIASNEKAKQILGWEPKETLHSIIQSAIDAHTKEFNEQNKK